MSMSTDHTTGFDRKRLLAIKSWTDSMFEPTIEEDLALAEDLRTAHPSFCLDHIGAGPITLPSGRQMKIIVTPAGTVHCYTSKRRRRPSRKHQAA